MLIDSHNAEKLNAIADAALHNRYCAPSDVAWLLAQNTELRELTEELCEDCSANLLLAHDDPRQDLGPIGTWWVCGQCVQKRERDLRAENTELRDALAEVVRTADEASEMEPETMEFFDAWEIAWRAITAARAVLDKD